MKYVLMFFLLFSGVIIPLACGNSNNVPTGISSSTKTFTPTQTGTVFTNTPTLSPTGANTATFTPTPLFTMVVQHNYGLTSAPNGLIFNNTASTPVLNVAEYSSNYGPQLEGFLVQNGGQVDYPTPAPNQSNYLWQGFPTPTTTPGAPGYVFSTVSLNGPQGFCNPGGATGTASVLDESGTSAVLYYGDSNNPSPNYYNGWSGYGLGLFWEPYSTTGYNGHPFVSPGGLASDGVFVYVADTGNSRVEQFNGVSPRYAWTGNSWSFTNAGGVPCTSQVFKQPYAVACDSNSPATVYVADNGYNPPLIEQFSSGGTTVTGAIYGLSGSVIHSLTVGASAPYYIYVADAGLGQVEVFDQVGNLVATITDPHSTFEAFGAYSPNCVAFDSFGYLWVGDTNNRCIVSFK